MANPIEFPLGPNVGQEHTHVEDDGTNTIWVCEAINPTQWARKTFSFVKADGTVPMTGQLQINPAAPTANSHAARKDYVDERVGFLEAITKTVSINASSDVFLYDTSMDDDGGAWVNKSNWQSWFKELGQFPKVALIYADLVGNKVYILDGNDNDLPVWCSFNIIDNNMLSGAVTSQKVVMKNGVLYHITASVGAIHFADFVNDNGYKIDETGHELYQGTISQRNDTLAFDGAPSGDGLSSTVCNAISIGTDNDGHNVINLSTVLGSDTVFPDMTRITSKSAEAQIDGYIDDEQVSIAEISGDVCIWDVYPKASDVAPNITLNSGSSPAILGTAKNLVQMKDNADFSIAVGSSTGLTLLSRDIQSTVQINMVGNSGGGENLPGASNDIVALDYDEQTNILTVCTGDTVAKFNGVNLVSSETQVGTSISTVCGKQVIGD